MTSIIEKRRSLHKELQDQQKHNDTLKLQIGQIQALANIGTNTAMIAHEINNLLTPLANYAALALQYPDDTALAEKALQKTAKNCDRAIKVAESILAVVTGQTQEKQTRRLKLLVEEIFSCLVRDFAKDQITVNIDISDDLAVWAVPVEIQQVLMNLILNARDAMLERGGTLNIKAWETEDTVQIQVCDTGCGINSADLERIFRPFFTTKNTDTQSEKSGSGLGLAFCKSIIDKCNGSICVESKPAEKTAFLITLPKKQ